MTPPHAPDAGEATGNVPRPMFTLDKVVLWGRSFADYQRMFVLGEDDRKRSILGCGDGPASFNAEATRLGARVVSCDPIYRFEGHEIEARTALPLFRSTRRSVPPGGGAGAPPRCH
jgi:hypothetical protein